MLKVVSLVDKENTALDRLAKGVAKYHDNLDYHVVAVHPKRPDQDQLARFQQLAMDADIIDAQYYRTLYKLREIFPWLKEKKTILTANNPYSIEEQSWNDVDMNVGNNEHIYKRLGEITEKPVEYIPITVDTDFWTFNPDWRFEDMANHAGKYERKGDTNKPTVIMVANRIESKKGILEVAIACAELNIRFVLVGAISDLEYFHSVQATGATEFYEQISDEKLRELYYNSTIHVCNSADNFESGTMPILEAMLCGVPVLTRKVGHVPELYNGENMVIHEGKKEDVQEIQKLLLEMISDKAKLKDMREKAWQTAKVRSFERRAYMYQKLYRQVMWPDEQSVSVVVPVYDKPEIIRKCLNAIAEQTHKNIEVVIADDFVGETTNPSIVRDFARYVSFPVRYLHEGEHEEEYGLARARNEATIEATGEIIVYCDQRMIMQPDAIAEFVKHTVPKTWLFGEKGARKETFIENFSCIRREDIMRFGLFNERINEYGGQSQELRTRAKLQGYKTEYIRTAKATPTGKSSNRNRKRGSIIRMKNRLWKMYDE